MDGRNGVRGQRPGRVPRALPRGCARGGHLCPVLVPPARAALLLARRGSRRADRGWARVRLRTRVPRRGIAGGRESGVPDRARVLRPRGPPIRSLLDRTATRERGVEGGNYAGLR